MTVSVIIPCYNAEPYLAQTIGSVLEQTQPPDELIVVDDGSTDGSLAIAESFGDRVRVLSKRNGSASRTRNYGASFATGEALMFLDADDVLGPTALEALTGELEQHPGSVVACPWYRLELAGGAWVRRPPSCAPRRVGQDALGAWLRGWYHPPCSVLWARAAYERTGGWDERGGPNDDGYLMMRALALEIPLRLTSEGEAFYRRLPEGEVSLSGTRFTEEGLRARIWVIERIAEMLEERGELEPHRTALGTAFAMIAADCGDRYPELAETCARHRRRYGDPMWKRAARRLQRHAQARLKRVQNKLSSDSRGDAAEAADPPEEIRYGLDFPSKQESPST
jgi:glycosyltransferase involved in cell wall biosynthesis